MIIICYPLVIMGAMAAASAAAQIAAQQQAQAQGAAAEDAQRIESENAIEINRRRATGDYLTQTRLEETARMQEEESLAEKSSDVFRQANKTKGTGAASAAERGIAGRTVDQIAQEYDFAANLETGRLRENQKLANAQHNENIAANGTEYTNRVTSIQPYNMQPQKPVDYFGPVFGAASQLVQTDVNLTRSSPTATTGTRWLGETFSKTFGTTQPGTGGK